MGISSLGLGSSILTQDVLDQLRKADESTRITPISLDLANENDKKNALELIDASMKNLIDSIDAIKSHTLYDERSTEVSGSAVTVSADSNSDIQDFTLEVTSLATKQIEESGSFSPDTETIATTSGSLNLNVDGEDFTIEYDATTSLKDLKKLINDTAGEKVDATIVQVSDSDFRLFISSVETGSNQGITLSDNGNAMGGMMGGMGGIGGLKDDRLTTQMTTIQAAADASFKFNGQDISRHSNSFDDLITGLDIELKEVGTSNVSILQNREEIMKKMDNFVEKYNSAITELNKMTKASADPKEKGIFSSDSTIKNMKRAIEDLVSTTGEGAGSMLDFGFDLTKDGVMSLSKTAFEKKLDLGSSNVESFLSGGIFKKDDTSTVEVSGAFTQIAAKIEEYTKYNATLDQYATSLDERITALTDRKQSATDRLDTKYEIMKKQFAAYDSMISKLNSASSMFAQMANAQIAAQKN